MVYETRRLRSGPRSRLNSRYHDFSTVTIRHACRPLPLMPYLMPNNSVNSGDIAAQTNRWVVYENLFAQTGLPRV
jgi:hypothetical protein